VASLKEGVSCPRHARIEPARHASCLSASSAFWVLLAGGVSLYFQLFYPPFTPILLLPDGLLYEVNALRMLRGQFIYRDFFQFTTPGLESFYFGAFHLLGPKTWIPNLTLLALALLIGWLSVALAKKILTGWNVLLPAALFLTFTIRGGLDATHHWFSCLADMAALVVLAEQRTTRRLVFSGLLAALGAWFTQAQGIATLVGFMVFVVWEHHHKKIARRSLVRALGWLVGSFLVGNVALNAFFALKAGLGRFIYCTIVFGSKYYSSDPRWNSIHVYFTEVPRLVPWYHFPALGVYLFPHLLLPLIYLLAFVRYNREAASSPGEPWDRLMLINITGFTLFLSVVPAPTWIHLSSVSMPGLVLLAWYVSSPGGFSRVLSRTLWVCAVFLAVAAPLERQFHWHRYFTSATGKSVVLAKLQAEQYEWFLSRTRPWEYFFGGESWNQYFELGLLNPTPIPYVTPFEYTRPRQVRKVIDGLEKHHVRFVLWQVDLYPGVVSSPSVNNLGPLIAYLKTHYRVVKTFSDSEQVWERLPGQETAHQPILMRGSTDE
jgi:hypothetical protein